MAERKLSSRRPGGVMTPNQLWTALEARYPKREYALLSEVRNSTGFSARTRTADALALSLWPSRGLDLHGIEIKAYRGDWKREKEAPEKAEEIARFCDFWWLAVTDIRVCLPLEEVPAPWGVLAPNEDATALVVAREATRLDPLPWSKGFVASVLRNVSDTTVIKKAVAAQIEEARRQGIEEGERRSSDIKELERLRQIEQDVREFQDAAGISLARIYKWQSTSPKKLGDALNALISGHDTLDAQIKRLEDLARLAELTAETARERIGHVRQAADLMATGRSLLLDEREEATGA